MSIAHYRETSEPSNSYWKAEERAHALLRHWLSPDQQALYDASGTFDVIGCDRGRRYRIWSGRIFNVQELDQNG